ncbi:MAG: hypothetical protein VYD54_08985 [Bdellovibrionota bacterium]|nr:hypothetical protein [Bdellovibrionota bacterium]
MKKRVLALLGVASAISGFQLGLYGDKTKITLDADEKKEVSSFEGSVTQKTWDSKKRGPQSYKENKKFEEESYFKSHLGDVDNLEIYVRTKELFKDFKNKEALAKWIVLGNFFSSSEKYSNIFENTIKKMNEEPLETLKELKSKIKKMSADDSFLRGMVVNLVHHLQVEDEEKASFFGEELGRSLTLDEQGGFSEDSFSVVPSLIYLRNYSKDERATAEFLKNALKVNKGKPKVQKALRARYLAYFPNIKVSLL